MHGRRMALRRGSGRQRGGDPSRRPNRRHFVTDRKCHGPVRDEGGQSHCGQGRGGRVT